MEILGMDACLMASIEVAYQAEPYVDYIVSSEDSEPNAGWKYSTILDVLNKNPGISVPELCCEMVKDYTESYEGLIISSRKRHQNDEVTTANFRNF